MQLDRTVAIYIRLSVEDEEKEEESESIKNQRNILTEYARKMEWEIYDIYCDEDFSGLDRERPEFNRMINEARDRKFGIILCKSQSRFTRDMEIAEKYISRLFVLWGIRFISLTDNIDSYNRGNKKARQINSLINEWYCEDLSESINAVFRSKMNRGEFIGSFAPYGYKRSENDKARLEIDEKSAEIVRIIFDRYLMGEGMKRIADYLTQRNIPTPTEYKRLKGEKFSNPNYRAEYSGIWSAGTIRNILKNRVYIGDMVQGKTKKISYKSKKIISVDSDRQICREATHKAIISRQDFERVAEILGERRVYDTKSRIKSVLCGKIFCGKCNNEMIRGSMNREKNGFYYICSLRKKSGGERCDNAGILNTIIETEIMNKIMDMTRDYLPKEETTLIKAENKEIANKNIISNKIIIADYEKRLKELYEDYREGILEREEFLTLKRSIMEEKREAKTSIDNLEVSSKENIFIKQLREGKLAKGMIEELIERVIVDEEEENNDRKIHIIWKI